MLEENRSYSRTEVSVPAILHDSIQNGEINCMVRDVSEKGICFEVPTDEEFVDNLRTGDSVHFQFIDTFQYGKESETDILSSDCTIRYRKIIGNIIRIGCYVCEKEFMQYAIRKEVVKSIGKIYATA